MKKLGKFLATIFSLAAVLGGAYYFYQNSFKKADKDMDDLDDFDDFDDLDDFDNPDIKTAADNKESRRGYTTLDMDASKADSDEEIKSTLDESTEGDDPENVEVDLND